MIINSDLQKGLCFASKSVFPIWDFYWAIKALWAKNSSGLIKKKKDANSYNTMCPSTF